MRQIKRPISTELPVIKMYLDDVQAIYDILKNNCNTVIIETDKYQITDITKLKDIGVDEIHEMSFNCQNPDINIELRPYMGRIYISEDSTLTRGILSQIEEILSKCKRKIVSKLESSLFYLLFSLLVSATIVLLVIFVELWLAIFWGVTVVLIYILLVVKSYRLSLRQHSTIILSERRERTNFFNRNRDQIIVGLIIAIVSVALTILAFKLFQWL